MSKLEPQIWVGCLAAYNNGKLHGEWIDANQDAEDLLEDIKAMLAKSPVPNAEEWQIFEYEDFGAIKVDKDEKLETIAKWAEATVRYGLPYTLWAWENHHYKHEPDDFDGIFYGHYSSLAEFAKEYYKQSNTVPEALESYIDWEGYGEDLLHGSFYCIKVDGDGVYIYDS